ncbi:MAG TPA: Xaa-Pro peptidase family protein [Vicinamibacterales bacterium]|nr:Xaa-Pro peptidase family protein [Vicinamibacterales bacterium]
MRIAPAERLSARVKGVRDTLSARHLDGLVVTSLPNIAYLTGFFASAGALVLTREDVVLVGDSRYGESLAARARECPFIRPVQLPPGASYEQELADVLGPFRGAKMGFEPNHLTVSRHRSLVKGLEQSDWDVPLVGCDGIVEQHRTHKDAWELAVLRDGGARLSDVAKRILSDALAGRTESEVAAEIEWQLRRAGFERPAFDTIVAAGPNAALPHGRAGQRRIERGDLVVLDFGGVLDGYCTDLSRTVAARPAGSRERQLIEHVVEAQAAAFAVVKPGTAPESVDEAARRTLAAHGMADAFTHGTGHGLGLEVHEAPRISRVRTGHAEPPLGPGMVLTLEPGAYFPGWGGVRIEDDVLVTNDGAEWLTDAPKVP